MIRFNENVDAPSFAGDAFDQPGPFEVENHAKSSRATGRTLSSSRAPEVYGELKRDMFSADGPPARFQKGGVMIETPFRALGYGVFAVREDA